MERVLGGTNGYEAGRPTGSEGGVTGGNSPHSIDGGPRWHERLTATEQGGDLFRVTPQVMDGPLDVGDAEVP